MTDFDLFDQAMAAFNKNETITCDQKCCHTETIKDNGILICVNCGEEILTNMSGTFYSQSFGKGRILHEFTS